MQNFLTLGAEVRGQLVVELARTVLAAMRAPGISDDIVFDVVGVHRDDTVDITSAPGPQVLRDEGLHLGMIHAPAPGVVEFAELLYTLCAAWAWASTLLSCVLRGR